MPAASPTARGPRIGFEYFPDKPVEEGNDPSPNHVLARAHPKAAIPYRTC